MGGCWSGWVDEASSYPTSTFRRSSVSKSQRHPSCGLMLMTKHIRNEVQGGGQIGRGGGCSRGCRLGEACEMELEEEGGTHCVLRLEWCCPAQSWLGTGPGDNIIGLALACSPPLPPTQARQWLQEERAALAQEAGKEP